LSHRALRESAWHLAAVLITVAVLTSGLRLDKADFRAPFTYDYDALLILPFVKEVVEGGHHWRTPRLGAPGVQELYDFPVIDHLHLAVIWGLAWAFPSPVVVFNVFYLLTYPLTAVTALAVCRRYGLSGPAAVAAGVLYAFQPYHYLRGQTHYFLAAYYMVPPAVMLMLDVCRGRLPFFPRRPDGTRPLTLRDRDTVVAVALALVISAAGAYYAFFTCALLVAAGLYGWVRLRTVRALLSAAGVTAAVVVGGAANHAPALVYQARCGQNSRPHERLAEEAEIYGMKMAQLLLPVERHNPVAVGATLLFDPAAIRSAYQAPLFKELNEADWDPLGLVGACGYLALLAAGFLPLRRGDTLGPLSALTVFATLLGTVGGFGAVFNLVASPQVRCYNRLSIFIAFAAVFVACRAVDRFFDTRAGAARHLRWHAFAALTAFGVWDQTNDQWFPDLRIVRPGYVSVVDAREAAAAKFASDAAFFRRVEDLVPGGMLFTYPFVEYPEARPYREPGAGESTQSYEFAVGYLHTSGLRFSYGAMKGREWDTWMRQVSGKEPVPQFLERVTLAGFEGLLIDTKGINPKRWNNLKRDLDQYLGAGAFREMDLARRLHFFDLRGYREALMRNYGAAGFEARVQAEREGLAVLWLKGFTSFEPAGYEDRVHYAGPGGLMVFVNRSDAAVTVPVRMRFRTTFKGPARLRIAGGLAFPAGEPWADDLAIDGDDKPPLYAREVVVPPGRHEVRFYCTPLTPVLPGDSRNHLFTILDFRTR